MRSPIRLLTLLTLFCGLLGPTSADELPVDKPEAVGLSSGKLGQIGPAVRQRIEDGELASPAHTFGFHRKTNCS